MYLIINTQKNLGIEILRILMIISKLKTMYRTTAVYFMVTIVNALIVEEKSILKVQKGKDLWRFRFFAY